MTATALAFRTNPPKKPDLSYHERNCKICRHPDREDIDGDILYWHSPRDIAEEFGISVRSIYRHANATGLLTRRRRNLGSVLDTFLEQSRHVPITGATVVRAIYARAHINNSGEWIGTPKRLIVTSDSGSGGPQIPIAPGGQYALTRQIAECVAGRLVPGAAVTTRSEQSLPSAANTPTHAFQPGTRGQTENDSTH